MARNKKLGKAVRERMTRTGENYTTARTRLLDEPQRELFRVRSVIDLASGDGEEARAWRTLRVRYVVRSGERVLDEGEKRFALGPDHTGWMRALVGLRAGGGRRIEGEHAPPFSLATRTPRPCVVEAWLLAVEPYVPPPPSDLVLGLGAAAAMGDRVRVRYHLDLRDAERTRIGGTGEAGLWVTLGRGELEPDLERVVLGMRAGGMREALLVAAGAPARWAWVELLERTA